MIDNSTLPTILVIGATGQIGLELTQCLSQCANVISTQREVKMSNQHALDLANGEQIHACVKVVQPDIVINAAAYTQVDNAETQAQIAETVNAKAPAILAAACAQLGAVLIHYSTDYVFDGDATTPYREEDMTAPRSVYGRTKLAGETGVRSNLDAHFIFRTSWVYAAHGKNFVRTIFEKAHTTSSLKVVNDQVGSPTSAVALAEQTKQLVERISIEGRGWAIAHGGTYHLAASGACTWHELACRIVEDIEPTVVVTPIPGSEYPTPAPRPLYSVLDCSKAAQQLGLRMSHWREQLRPVLEALRARQ